MRFAFLFKMATLILWRSWRMTLILSFMVTSAVAILVFLSALAVGTSDAMIRNSVGLFSGHIAASGVRESDLEALQRPGVKKVLARKQQPVLISAGTNLEAVNLVGVNPADEQDTTAYWKKTVQGRFISPGSATIFVAQETARRLKLSVGDTVSLANPQGRALRKLKVSGIYKTGIAQLDIGLAFCPDSALPQWETEQSAAVFLHDNASLDAVTDQYRATLPTVTFSRWTDFMPDLKQLVDLNAVCMGVVIVLVFAIVAVGISCSFLIFTLKNLREHGILKAMGLLPRDTTLLLLNQIGLLAIISAAVGTLVGAAISAVFSRYGIDISTLTSHNQYFAISGMLYPRLTLLALVAPPGTAILFSLVAAIWPIAYILRETPASILRSL